MSIPKTLLLSLLAFSMAGCGGKTKKAQEVTPEVVAHQWTDEAQGAFRQNCVTILEQEGVESAANYCDCLLESSITNYPDPEMAMELEQHEIVTLFESSNCLDELLMVKIEDPWTMEVSSLFLEHCKEGQIAKGQPQSTADQYCSCALEKVREIIPNPQHVISLTEEELTEIMEQCNSDQ